MEPVKTLKKMTKEEMEDHEYERINVEQESVISEHSTWSNISSSGERILSIKETEDRPRENA